MKIIMVLSLLLALFSAGRSFCAPRAGGPKPATACSYMVVVPEQHIAHPVPDPAGETEVVRQLTSHGLRIVDGDQQAADDVRYGRLMDLANKDPKEAANLGRKYGADIIIVGEAFSEFAERNSTGVSCHARFEARAIRTADGSIVFTDNTVGSGLDIAELVAGKTACQAAAAEWSRRFLSAIGKGGDSHDHPDGDGRKTLAILGFGGWKWVYADNPDVQGGPNGLSETLADLAMNVLMQEGRYQLVERSRIHDLLDEQHLSLEGVTDSQGATLGGLARADIVLIGNITQWHQSHTGMGFIGVTKVDVAVQGRLVDVRTGKILALAEGQAESIEPAARDMKAADLLNPSKFSDTPYGKATTKALRDLLSQLGYPCPPLWRNDRRLGQVLRPLRCAGRTA